MSQFRFGIGDYVKVPHFNNVQGVVHEQANHIFHGKRYTVQWQSGPLLSYGTFTEGEMAQANAPAVVVEGITADEKKRRAEALADAKAREREVARVVKPRKRAKKKAPSKRKR